MPIYAYRCASCGHLQDILQKLSDPHLTVCPQCSQPSFSRQLTAAGFQLKGSGWYATDFRESGKKPAAAADKPGAGATSDAPAVKTDAAPADAATKPTSPVPAAPAPSSTGSAMPPTNN
jgi:putative FmdB family regulatory protein